MLAAHHRHHLSAFFQDFALSSAFALVPFYIYDHIGGGARMSGGVSAVQSLCYAAACLVVARYAAGFRHPIRVAVLGCIGFAVLMPLVTITGTGLQVGTVTVAALVSLALYWPAMQSWLGGEPNSRVRAKRMADYTVAWSLGLAVGPLFTGWLYDHADERYAFGLVAATTLIAAALAWSLPEVLKAHAVDEHPDAEPVDVAECERHLYPTWVANFLSWGMVGAMRGVYPKRVHELVDESSIHAFWPGGPFDLAGAKAATVYAVLLLSLYGARAATSYWMGLWHGWHGRYSWVLLSQVGAALALYGLGVSSSLAVISVCCLLIGFNGGITFFASLYYSVADPARRHGRAAIHESLVGIGGFCVAIVVGELGERFGVEQPFIYAPGVIVAAIAVQGLLYWRSAMRRAI